jgi:hypothetical protein
MTATGLPPSLGMTALAKICNLFRIDTRSLGFLRIGLATLVLWDLILHAQYLRAHLTDFGVLPTWSTSWLINYQPGHWSLHLASGTWQWQLALLMLQGMAAVALLVGYRTRWATMLTWLLLCSIQTRHPLLLNGGDHLMRMLLFWSIFLPLGARWSIDNYRLPQGSSPSRIFSAATVAIMLQMCFMYWVSGFTKTDPLWTETRWALYYALNVDHIANGFGKWLLNFPELLRWLSLATLWLECWGPFLLFIPFFTARIRTLVILAFIGFHFGIFLCMDVGLFSWVSIVGWTVFLPGSVWDWLGRRFPSLSAESAASKTAETNSAYARLINLTVAVLMIYGAVFNLQVLAPNSFRWFDHQWKSLGYVLRFEQRWDLFASPVVKDGWLVAVATLQDGSQVDLHHGGQPVNWEKPAMLSDRYRNTHRRMYFANLKQPSKMAAAHRQFYVAYLKRDWHERNGGQRRIQNVDLYIVAEFTKPYPEIPEQKRVLLYRDKSRRELGDIWNDFLDE